MRLELTGRHVDITPGLRRLVESKLARLDRMLNDRAISAQAVLSREKRAHRADITLHARGEKFLHGVGANATWEGSVGQAIEKLVQQAQKVKGKYEARKRGAEKAAGPIEEAAPAPRTQERATPKRVRRPAIFHAARQTLTAMSVTDAARALDGNRDDIVVFRDVETSAVSVLYRRRNGDLTLVQTEA